jgi:hypothetical protein
MRDEVSIGLNSAKLIPNGSVVSRHHRLSPAADAAEASTSGPIRGSASDLTWSALPDGGRAVSDSRAPVSSMTVRPAAAAELTPIALSSMAKLAGGSIPSARQAARYGSGAGLGRGTSSALTAAAKYSVMSSRARTRSSTDRGDDAAELVEELPHLVGERQFGGIDGARQRALERAQHVGCPRPAIGPARQLPGGRAERRPPQQREPLPAQLKAKLARHRAERGVPALVGVGEHAVAVEDDADPLAGGMNEHGLEAVLGEDIGRELLRLPRPLPGL